MGSGRKIFFKTELSEYFGKLYLGKLSLNSASEMFDRKYIDILCLSVFTRNQLKWGITLVLPSTSTKNNFRMS